MPSEKTRRSTLGWSAASPAVSYAFLPPPRLTSELQREKDSLNPIWKLINIRRCYKCRDENGKQIAEGTR
jgi:hypothetical protein